MHRVMTYRQSRSESLNYADLMEHERAVRVWRTAMSAAALTVLALVLVIYLASPLVSSDPEDGNPTLLLASFGVAIASGVALCFSARRRPVGVGVLVGVVLVIGFLVVTFFQFMIFLGQHAD